RVSRDWSSDVCSSDLLEGGDSNIDESLLTGESRPRRVAAGDHVAAGTVNLTRAIYVRSIHTGQDTRLAQLVRDMERASERRAPEIGRAPCRESVEVEA